MCTAQAITKLRLKLAKKEAMEPIPLQGVTRNEINDFLCNALDLEVKIADLTAELRGDRHLQSTAAKQMKLQTKLNTHRKAMKYWRKKLNVFMPKVPTGYGYNETQGEMREVEDSEIDASALDLEIVTPSSLSVEERQMWCNTIIVETEAELRFAQAENALDQIRNLICVSERHHKFQKRHLTGTGQASNTRNR